MPRPGPGLKRVRRWRGMIAPPVTAWPAKVLTPGRWAVESGPLRLEPSPFLCAICGRLLLRFCGSHGCLAAVFRGRFGFGGGLACGFGRGFGFGRRLAGGFGFRRLRFGFARGDLGDLDPGQLLAVAVAALVSALRLELEDPELLTADVLEHLRGDLDLLERGLVEHRLVRPVEERLQRDIRALRGGEPLDEQGLAPLDAVLLAAGLDDRVHALWLSNLRVWTGWRYSLALALAAGRRRPPLRPRRRGLDCRPSSPASPGAAASPVGEGCSGSSSIASIGPASPASRRASSPSLSACARPLRPPPPRP